MLNEHLIPQIITIAKQAGQSTLPFYTQQKQLNIQRKSDYTPLTDADLCAHDIIIAALQKLTPEIPIISEEDELPEFSVRSTWDRYWLVDPLDGTRGFINQEDEFTVNIALIEKHTSVLGVIYAPAKNICYFAMRDSDAKASVFKQIDDQPRIEINSRPLDWKNI